MNVIGLCEWVVVICMIGIKKKPIVWKRKGSIFQYGLSMVLKADTNDYRDGQLDIGERQNGEEAC